MSEGDGNGKECLARSSLDSCLFCPLAAHCPTMMHSTLIRSALLCCSIIPFSFPPTRYIVSSALCCFGVDGMVLFCAPWHRPDTANVLMLLCPVSCFKSQFGKAWCCMVWTVGALALAGGANGGMLVPLVGVEHWGHQCDAGQRMVRARRKN